MYVEGRARRMALFICSSRSVIKEKYKSTYNIVNKKIVQ